MKFKLKALFILLATFGLLNISSASAENKYPTETKEYMDFINKLEKDTTNTEIEIKDIDSMSAFNRQGAELKYEREDGIIGATINMRDFYDYQVATTDGNNYLYNKELCYINPYVKKVKIIKRKGWGYFLMPVDSQGILSETRDCSAVKNISPEMNSLLDNAIGRNN